jgi:4a-hydroxytetrahydrobiopterin dehydratase
MHALTEIFRRNMQMKLNEEQIQDALSRIADWGREGDWLTRDLKFDNFKGAMEFVNRVADEAEAMDHHPDILIHDWNKVRLSVMTHSEGGLTEKDFKLAERINRLV